MKWISIILLFFFIFPIFPVFSPIPTDRMIELLGFGYVFIAINKNQYILKNKFVLNVGGLALILFLVAFAAQFNNTDGFETALIKNSIDIVLLIFGAFFICDIIRKSYKQYSIVRLLEIVVLVFFIQGVISLLFYFLPNLYNSFTSILNTDVSQNLYERLHLSEIRLMGVGNAFFNGVIKYGICFIILTFLRYNQRSFFSQKGWIFLFLYLFFIIVGVMTGRTFFIAILLSGLVIFYYESKKIDKFIVKILFTPIIVFLLLVPFYLVFKHYVDVERFNKTLDFVFELFNSYEESGSFSTTSSDATLNMYVWPNRLSTWFFGDGKFLNSDGSYYMHTDVGYLRYIYYFGIIGTLTYFFIQYRMMSYFSKLAKDRNLSFMAFFLLCWVMILNLKGIANVDFFAVLFIIGALVDSHSKRGIKGI